MFKSKLKKWQDKNVPVINETLRNHKEHIESVYELYERLGQKVKDNKVDTSMIFIELFKYLGVKLTEDGKIIKTKNVKPKTISTSGKNHKRTTK